MNRSRQARVLALTGLLALVVAACDGETADLTTTSSLVSGGTTPSGEATTTSVAPGGDSTTTSLVGETVSGHEIVARESESAGETLYIVIPPGAYTDVDIENFVLDLVEGGTVTFGGEIFDDAAAVDAYRKPEGERTEDETALIAQHHFASVLNGTTVRYQGPFASSGEFVIGS
jgi:hypothetical protein